jgi:hypothetical protein
MKRSNMSNRWKEKPFHSCAVSTTNFGRSGDHHNHPCPPLEIAGRVSWEVGVPFAMGATMGTLGGRFVACRLGWQTGCNRASCWMLALCHRHGRQRHQPIARFSEETLVQIQTSRSRPDAVRDSQLASIIPRVTRDHTHTHTRRSHNSSGAEGRRHPTWQAIANGNPQATSSQCRQRSELHKLSPQSRA